MLSKKLNLAVIGAGRMGITHYSIINSHPDVTIASVADPSLLVLTMINKYLSAQTFKDYNDLLEKNPPDALLICTPPNLHYPVIKKAAQRGIHVFVEKPFTTRFTEAKELTKLFTQKGLVNQVGYVYRFNDVFRKTKELIEAGIIGKVFRFKSEMFSATIIHSDEGSGWRFSRESGGGAVFEMASHAIDLVNFLIGKPDKITGSSLSHIYSKNVEDAVSSTFLYKNGVIGTIYINWSDTSYRKLTNKIEIFGEGGRILADQHSLKMFLNAPNSKYSLQKGWNTLYITDIFQPVPFYVRGNEFTRQLFHFVNCIQGKSAITLCSFADGMNTLEIIENIFRDYENNVKPESEVRV
jgi:scyllo-inositol 2-dehydrogenase (NADP+)